jgi:hypothetical protein
VLISSFVRHVSRNETTKELVQVIAKKLDRLTRDKKARVKDPIGRATTNATVTKGKGVTLVRSKRETASPGEDGVHQV